MHTSGKVLAGFVIVLAAVAVWMSAKAYGTRKAWMEAAQKNQAEIEKNEELIATKQKLVDDKRAELARLMIGWDRYWPGLKGNVRADGTIALSVGTNHGIRQDQLLWVFAENAD